MTKPTQVIVQSDKPWPWGADLYAVSGFQAAMVDSYNNRWISRDTPEATLRALFTRAGGETDP